MKRPNSKLQGQRGPIAFGALLIVFALAVLLPGLQLAGRLDDTAAALRLVSEQGRQPEVLAGALASVRDRIEAFGYIDEPLAEVRSGSADFERMLARLGRRSAGSAFEADPARAVGASTAMRASLAQLQETWASYRGALEPVRRFSGVPYADSESAGTHLNPAGHALARDSQRALAAAHKATPLLASGAGRLAAALEAESARLSGWLRLLMLAALAGALALGVALGYFALARRREAHQLLAAQRQTEDILRTVKDGLFLLDASSRIGATHSASVQRLFKREKLAGLSFEELLRPLVPERTLQTALKFVEVLWSERTKENLVRSINPLQEIEVSFDTGSGAQESHWLEFDFHRVRSDGRLVSLLVSVNDVTARVQLARELAESQEKAQTQLDTLLGVLHVDVHQLRSFLADSAAAMKMVNSILRDPAREESAFRKKLDSIFRQIHSIKGEAAALGLATVESRAHEFEGALKELRERTALSGGDFLPLVVKLDDLFTHLGSLGDLVTKLGQLNFGPDPAAGAAPAAAASAPAAAAAAVAIEVEPATAPARAVAADDPIGQTLTQLAARLAQDRGKTVRLQADGLADVPADYRRAIKDITVQMVRNSLVHGIESPDLRTRGGKPAGGTIKVEFRSEGPAGYRLVVEDDGAGLSPARIRAAAVQRGLVTNEEAARLDSKQLLAFLFRPGFTTQDSVDEDAGRGVGMNVVAELVKELHGRVGIATGEGRYTRFTIVLPAPTAAAAGAAA